MASAIEEAAIELVMKGTLSSSTGGDSGMVFDRFDAESEANRSHHYKVDGILYDALRSAVMRDKE